MSSRLRFANNTLNQPRNGKTKWRNRWNASLTTNPNYAKDISSIYQSVRFKAQIMSGRFILYTLNFLMGFDLFH
jgi:hypothetical protein